MQQDLAHAVATGATWKREFFLKVMPVGSTSESWSRRPWRIHQIARYKWETYVTIFLCKSTGILVYFYFKHVQCITHFLGQTCWTQAVVEELVRLVSTDRKPYKLEILGQESELEKFETSQNSETAARGTWRLDVGLLKLKWDLLSGTVVLCVLRLANTQIVATSCITVPATLTEER